MQDLNTLIQPGTGYQLTNAFNINDRGEILAKAAPLGFTPNDDADLGHLVLLVPCADDGDCAANIPTAMAAASQTPAALLKNSTTTTASPLRPLSPRESVTAWRSELMRRYHVLSTAVPKQ